MARRFRIGTQIWPDDPFWVQVRVAIEQAAQQHDVELVLMLVDNAPVRADEQALSLAEEVLAQNLDALISWDGFDRSTQHILAAGLPVIYLAESRIQHPLFVAPQGLHDSAMIAGDFLAERLDGHGKVLAVGGLLTEGEAGRSRLAGIQAAVQRHPGLHLQHIPSLWRYEQAYPQILDSMRAYGRHVDAIFGFSDSLALAARDAGRELGIVDERTLIVGINGDPLALAAITQGSMSATVRTSAADLGTQALELAVRAAQGLPLPPHFGFQPQLVTAHNVAEVAVQQLTALASLPSRLVGFSRRQQQQRLVQLETSLEINRRAGLLLDRQQLSHAIADLIRVSYGYDEVQLSRWDAASGCFVLEQPDAGDGRPMSSRLAESPVLCAALEKNEPIFIPDTRHSLRFRPDPLCPEARSRVVLPVRLGGQILALLDLRSSHSTQHSHHELVGLQTLADQLGIAMRNAELYEEAVEARARAEKADQLKTRLLANVSHELRTPLNVILGYSQSALSSPTVDGRAMPPTLRRDMQHIYNSGEHLIRLINDLLDLSRAEIDELEIFPEAIGTRAFLQELFDSFADHHGANGAIAWRLELPDQLPALQADPVRVRQILLNLLHNARKFTDRGAIVLGAEVALPYLHVWVADTGRGIPIELQERIWEPFVSGQEGRRPEGIGLGLTITRRLVALHRGSMSLESQSGQGSTFHVYLPLPNLSGQPLAFDARQHAGLLVIAPDDEPDAGIAALAQRQGLRLRPLRCADDLATALADVQPVAIAWKLGRASAAAWTIFEAIRAQPQLVQLPCLFFFEGASGAAGTQLGLTNVLVKPTSGEKLLEAIDRVRPQDLAGPVLIVDDDEEAHALYRRLLAPRFAGYAFRNALDGREALEILAHTTPSLVILDLMMPHVDGFAVLHELRAKPRTRDVPVLVLSGQILSPEDVRRLSQAHVTFHSKDVLTADETAAAAERSLTQTDAVAQQTSGLVKQAMAYMQQNYANSLSRQEIADAVGVNKDYLSRIFQRELGISPWDYLNRFRVRRAKELLRATDHNITAIAMEVGFDDASYFSRVFSKEVGCSPRDYRERL